MRRIGWVLSRAARTVVPVLMLMGWMGLTATAQEEGGGGRQPDPKQITSVKAERTPVKTVKVEVPVTQAARSNTPVFRGEGWFYQRCAECHAGRWRKNGQLKPVLSLDGILKDAEPGREADVRKQIQQGSLNMPGYQNAFSPAQLDELIAYLKTL